MTHLTEVDKVEECDFKWGKKRGVGGKRKEVQFYESFTYNGVEYSLYDCVYLYKEGEPEPYIGKLIKIWEYPDKEKKIKVLWFFHPSEILKWLGDGETIKNELFLASGEGVGLANVNPLEAIAGKCNVVCISKDSRNPQPSNEELQMADHVFYRTFDVGNCTILDKIDDKIAGVEVEFIFNRRVCQNSNEVPKMDSNRKEDIGRVVASSETLQLPERNSSGEDKDLKIDGNSKDALANENVDVKVSLVEHKSSLGGKHASDADMVLDNMTNISVERENIVGDGSKLQVDYVKYDDKVGKVLVNQVEVEEKVKSTRDSGLLDSRPSKKAKVSSSTELSEDRNNRSLQKSNIDSHVKEMKASVSIVTTTKDKTKLDLVKDSPSLEKEASKKLKSYEKTTKLSNGNLIKAFARRSPSVDTKIEGQIMEVTRRPNADRSRWFRGLPWEERMQTAHQQGTLVLLQNLDPAYTSAEVEDIVWHGFKESCTARMIQRTTISSPHSGQAFVIFKTRDAAVSAIRKLEEGCLLLSNGRPLVGSFGTPCFPGKQSTFVGHLSIDKVKVQMQREMKQAVSTSHCSQPNTIEYEMAMDWCLQQERSDSCWKKLYKRQGDELRKLKASLKSK